MPRILAIDDKQGNLTSVSALLENLIPDCTVVTVQSGAEGMKKVKAELPDTILLDIKMPEMDGFKVCEWLKSDEKTKHIPIIMLTAIKTDAESRVKGLELGADAFLSKRIDKTELVAQVNVMLRIKKAEDLLRKEKDLLEEMVQERTEALRESEERYRNLVETSQDLIFRCDSEGRYIYLNPAWKNILGYTVDEMLGRHFSVFKPPETAEKDLKTFMNTLKGSDSFGYETVYITKSGAQKNLIFNARMLKDTDGNIIGTQGTAYDISERKRVEDEGIKLENQLQQAQKMEAIGTLAGGIAHDFNNILTSIMGYTEMAQFDIPEENRAHQRLDHVMKASFRAKDLVKQILAFSRQSEQERRPVQIYLIVKEALKLLRASIPTSIEIRQNIPVISGAVIADPTKIHQVMMNLCTNAYHSMRESGGVLDVNLKEEELISDDPVINLGLNPGRYLKLTVKDTGRGMDSATIARIFDPYFTTKEKDVGTGLGLAVVDGIVKNHGGTITVESEVGKGTAFHAYLPLVESKARTKMDEPKPPPTGDERILFVDDEEPIAEMGKQMLELLGYDVLMKTSSPEALRVFQSEPEKFNLVVTDMTMPTMTGDRLAKELLRIKPDIPIILCTGFSDQIDEKKSQDIGIQALIMKPLLMNEMARTIRKVLDQRIED